MKVVLCSVAHDAERRLRERKIGPVLPRMAVVTLLRWMEKYGYSGEFYDIDMLLPSEDEIFNYFKSEQPDVVGISAVTSGTYLQAKTTASIIRRACPSAWIVLGGNMAASANVILRKTDVDICALGDGEKTFVHFLDYVKNYGRNKDVKELSKIKGIAFLNEQNEMEFTGYGESILANENPFPDYRLLSKGCLSKPKLVENYFEEGKEKGWFKCDSRTYEPHRKPKQAFVFTTKGCVSRCTFCQRFSKGYRVFDLEKLDLHLADLKENYNVGFIHIADENFGSNKKHAYEVAKLMKKHDMLWLCSGARCISFTQEDMKFFKECGCTAIKFGVESGSQKILDIMEKRFTVNDVYTALKAAHECRLASPPVFCIGMPGETDQTIMETGRFLGSISRAVGALPYDWEGCQIYYALPLPGSPLYEYGQLQGAIGVCEDDEEAILTFVSGKIPGKNNFINLTGMKPKTVMFWDLLLKYEAMRTFYHSPISTTVPERKQHCEHEQKSKSKTHPIISVITKVTNTLRNYWWKPITLLNEVMIRNYMISRIPRPLVYIPMRDLSYMQYKLQIFFTLVLRLFGTKFMQDAVDFQLKLKPCKPLTEWQSLRKINQKIRETLPVPKSLTEKNQQILRLGQ